MSGMTRRHFIERIGIGALGSLAGAAIGAAASKHPVPLGIQLYLVRDALEKDFDGTLRALAAIGYRHVELPSFFGRSARQLKESFAAAGLHCRSSHVPPSPFLPGDPSLGTDLPKVIEFCAELGLEYIVSPIPRVGPELAQQLEAAKFDFEKVQRVFAQLTLDDWKRYADFLNETGATVRRAGLKLAHHTHNLEFRDFDGRTGFDVLLKSTDPALVSIELDCGWVAAAGRDPVPLLEAHAARIPLLHLKDLTSRYVPNTLLQMESIECGRGTVKWPRLLAAAQAAGVRCAYIEQEPPFSRPTVESARISLEYLRAVRYGAHDATTA
jgi:sugar phosphate isomerase/epimerase